MSGRPMIFVSSSGTKSASSVARLRQILEPRFEVMHESVFRPSGAWESPRESWEYQFRFTRTAHAMLVVLVGHERNRDGGTDVSDGQQTEVIDAVWRGIPVIWCGFTEAGHKIAHRWHNVYSQHPCVLSHLFDARCLDSSNLEVLQTLCFELSKVERPHLPSSLCRGVASHFEHTVCVPTEGGWRRKDLMRNPMQPLIRVSRGWHTTSYYEALQQSRAPTQR
jgi:hypothetical protein